MVEFLVPSEVPEIIGLVPFVDKYQLNINQSRRKTNVGHECIILSLFLFLSFPLSLPPPALVACSQILIRTIIPISQCLSCSIGGLLE